MSISESHAVWATASASWTTTTSSTRSSRRRHAPTASPNSRAVAYSSTRATAQRCVVVDSPYGGSGSPVGRYCSVGGCCSVGGAYCSSGGSLVDGYWRVGGGSLFPPPPP